MTIYDAVKSISEDKAREWAQIYYGTNGDTAYAGAYFELLGAQESDPNRLYSSDFYSISSLSVDVPAVAGFELLGRYSADVARLLPDIPADLDLCDVHDDDYERYLGGESAAWKLWDLLRAKRREEGRWRVRPTTASKLMARKRPKLFPIEDGIVNKVIGHRRNSRDSWRLWWEAFQMHGDELEKTATIVREAANRPDLSSLRALDVVLWMRGKRE